MKNYLAKFFNGLKKRKYLIVLMGIVLVFFLLSTCKDGRFEDDKAIFERSAIIQKIYNSYNGEKRALQLSRNLVRDYPNHHMSHWLLGGILLSYGDQSDTLLKDVLIQEGLNELKISLEINKPINTYVKNQVLKFNLIYAQTLEENNRLEKSLTHFEIYFDGNKDIVLTDPDLREFVFSYGDVLGKMGRNIDAMNKYKELFDANGRDPRLIQGYMKMLSDYESLQGALDIANDYEHYAGFNIRVAFGKCQALFDHKVFDQAKPCLESLNEKITKDEDVDFNEESMRMLEVIDKE